MNKRREIVNEIHQEILKLMEKGELSNDKFEVCDYIKANAAEEIHQAIYYELYEYGPITALIGDPTITEIMANGHEDIYIERDGKLSKTDVQFDSQEHLMRIIDKIASEVEREVNVSSPYVDARLPDGSRVNAAIPPISVDGPALTIRKFSKDPYTAEDLIRFGTWNNDIVFFLKQCVKGRLNIVISGGTGSGKTTTLNILSGFIPESERIVTIEDAAELQLRQEHKVRLESRPPNNEGLGAVTIRDLVINTLRMRPDRIIVGECRGPEALDMLQAMNTGHDGSLTTIHSNSPRDTLRRIEKMVLYTGIEIPVAVIRDDIASAIDLVAHQARFPDGSRRITHVEEITGMEGDVITTQTIYACEPHETTDGDIVYNHFPLGIVPTGILKKMRERGITIPVEMFKL